MIAGLLLVLAAATFAPEQPPAAAPALLGPAEVVARYAVAIAAVREPHVISFDYRLEQTGQRRLEQTHRIFRTPTDERDETLSVDGKRLVPPTVRIYRGKRNRYTVAALAPKPAQYDFAFAGLQRDGHHVDYIFRLTPKKPAAFAITDVTIDGIKFLPQSIRFRTQANAGSGSVRFGPNGRWWLPLAATARAKVGTASAAERLTFSAYRFPIALPPETFSPPRPLAAPPAAARGPL